MIRVMLVEAVCFTSALNQGFSPFFAIAELSGNSPFRTPGAAAGQPRFARISAGNS